MSYVVYKHTCPNGKVYIGITGKNPIKRWCNGNGYKHNIHFTSAGVVFTNERKNNISIANKGKNHGVSKRVKHIESGMIYDSVSLAAKSLNLNVSGISKCCTGKLKSYHKQHFEYIGEF